MNPRHLAVPWKPGRLTTRSGRVAHHARTVCGLAVQFREATEATARVECHDCKTTEAFRAEAVARTLLARPCPDQSHGLGPTCSGCNGTGYVVRCTRCDLADSDRPRGLGSGCLWCYGIGWVPA